MEARDPESGLAITAFDPQRTGGITLAKNDNEAGDNKQSILLAKEQWRMRMPDEQDLTFLFEGDREQLNRFIEKYKERFQKGRLMNDIEEMAGEFTIEEQIPIVFSFVFGVTVDWREYDEEIVRLFGERLPDETVEVDNTKDGLLVTYNGAPFPVRLSFSGKDRYITIRGFNEIIQPKYEIRLFEGSYMSDTHDFLVLPKESWEELEKRYPTQLADTFRVVDGELDFP